MSSFTLGAFTVREMLRPDNPAFCRYVVYLGGRLIGSSFSRPDEGWCAHLLRRCNEEISYLEPERKQKLRGVALTRRGNRERTDRLGWLSPAEPAS